ncbi:22093_t:CDS:2, partial [Racocetra persica]
QQLLLNDCGGEAPYPALRGGPPRLRHENATIYEKQKATEMLKDLKASEANLPQVIIEDPLNNLFLELISLDQESRASTNKAIGVELDHINIISESDGRLLNSDSNQWIVDTIDITCLLLHYHELSIEKASENIMKDVAEILSEILSLNHIFLFDEHAITGIQVMFDKQLWEDIFKSIKIKFASYELSDCDIIRLFKQVATNIKDCRSLLRQWQIEIEDYQEDVVLEVFKSMQDKVMYLLVAEVKPTYKETSDDLIKLGNGMKGVIDKCINDGINIKGISICGLLIEGVQCSVFVMDLDYEAMYRMILLDNDVAESHRSQPVFKEATKNLLAMLFPLSAQPSITT